MSCTYCFQNCGLNHTKRGCDKVLANLFTVPAGDVRTYSLNELLRADNQFPPEDYNSFLDAGPELLHEVGKNHLDTAGRIYYSLLTNERAAIRMNRLTHASVFLWAKLIRSGETQYAANTVPDDVLAHALQQVEFTKKGFKGVLCLSHLLVLSPVVRLLVVQLALRLSRFTPRATKFHLPSSKRSR